MTTQSSDPAKIHPAIAQTLVRTIESYGIDAKALLAQAGVDMDMQKQASSRIDGSKIDDIWRLALKATNDDAIGIKFASHFRLGSLHGLGFSWAASSTLMDAFDRLSRYFAVISNVGKVKVKDVQDHVEVALVLPVPYGIAQDSAIDSALALFMHLCRMVHSDQFKPVKVEFQRPAPNSSHAFDDFFQCPIQYGAKEDKLVFYAQDMREELSVANPDLARANDQVVIDYLRKHEAQQLVGKVTALMIDALPSGTPTQQMVADQLHMSSKTLQRRLSAENTTFSNLLDDVRIDLAKKYLAQKWRSIGEICYLLGYSEPSNFTRWFRGMTGVTPLGFREALV